MSQSFGDTMFIVLPTCTPDAFLPLTEVPVYFCVGVKHLEKAGHTVPESGRTQGRRREWTRFDDLLVAGLCTPSGLWDKICTICEPRGADGDKTAEEDDGDIDQEAEESEAEEEAPPPKKKQRVTDDDKPTPPSSSWASWASSSWASWKSWATSRCR